MSANIRIHSTASFVFKAMLVWLAISTLYSLLRLASPSLGINQESFGLLANSFNLAFVILAAVAVTARYAKTSKISIHLVFLILLLVYGSMLGFLHSANLIEAAKHVYIFLFSFIFFYFGYKSVATFHTLHIVKMFKLSFWLNLIAVVLYTVAIQFIFIYPGYGTHAIAYTALCFLTFGHTTYFLISFFLLVAQGKRSIFIAFLLCLFIHVATRYVRVNWLSALIFSLLLCLGIAGFYALEVFDLYDMPGLSRFRLINPFANEYDVFRGSSGRSDEILSALSNLNNIIYAAYTGAGFGFTYEWQVSYDDNFSEIKSYLHNVPIMLYILVGPVFASIFYFYVLHSSTRLLSKGPPLSTKVGQLQRFYALSSLFFIIAGVFSLNILSDPLGWVFVGLTCASCKQIYSYQKIQSN